MTVGDFANHWQKRLAISVRFDRGTNWCRTFVGESAVMR
jgi:hypothetical protein